MVMLRDLRPASFRGARFLCPHDRAEEGRNVIDHRYPDSNIRYAEDNGYVPPEFRMTCILHGPNVLSDFAALRAALNQPGPGTLHHPWYGAQFVAAKTWCVRREDRDSGVLEIEACFLVTGPAVFPGRTHAIAALVTGLSATFVANLFTLFQEQYGRPNLSAVTETVLSESIATVASTFLTVFGSVSDVQTAATHLSETPERYVTDGAALGPELQTMFRGPFEDLAVTYSGADITTGMAQAASQAGDIVAAAQSLPVTGPTATHDYQIRAATLYTFATFVQLACLSSMAEAMAGTIYTTAEAVAAAERQLLALHAAIPTETLPSETADQIAKIVTAAMDVLRQQEFQLPNIGDLNVVQFPSSVLSYMLYDSDERTETLVDLNEELNPVLYDGDVNILIGAV